MAMAAGAKTVADSSATLLSCQAPAPTPPSQEQWQTPSLNIKFSLYRAGKTILVLSAEMNHLLPNCAETHMFVIDAAAFQDDMYMSLRRECKHGVPIPPDSPAFVLSS